MNKKKKIIVSLIISLFIVCCSSYLIWNYYQTKDDQEKVETERQEENNSEIENPKNNKTSPDKEIEQQPADNSPDVENSEKKEENVEQQENNDQQLVSYFSVFIVSWIIIIIAYFLMFQPSDSVYLSINQKTPDPYLYLMFIKMVCEMVCYENSMVHETKNSPYNSDKYKPHLQLDLNNLQKFLDTFLFQPQIDKNKVRQQAHQIILCFRNRFQRIYWILFFYFFLGYLFVLIVNLIFNILFRGFFQTFRRLKINYLWMFIPKMNKRFQRVVSYLLISLTPLSISIFFAYIVIPIIISSEPKINISQQRSDPIGYYWLLERFYFIFNEEIEALFTEKKYKNFNFINDIQLIDKKQDDLLNHNLDSANLEDFVISVIDYDYYFAEKPTSFCQEGKIFFEEMKNYFDPNDAFEKDILQKLQNFMNTDQIKVLSNYRLSHYNNE